MLCPTRMCPCIKSPTSFCTTFNFSARYGKILKKSQQIGKLGENKLNNEIQSVCKLPALITWRILLSYTANCRPIIDDFFDRSDVFIGWDGSIFLISDPDLKKCSNGSGSSCGEKEDTENKVCLNENSKCDLTDIAFASETIVCTSANGSSTKKQCLKLCVSFSNVLKREPSQSALKNDKKSHLKT
uniref:Uncharacterized protein n=1 Tax=Romanomermis culicivorax TaxID=13658 RepID=A0A915ISM0_ROMCU